MTTGNQTTHDLFEPVQVKTMDPQRPTCDGCVFSYEIGCGRHACTASSFPDDHPLSQATHPIIWRKKQ